MKRKTRRGSPIDSIIDLPWGTHMCHFYETKKDLLEILTPYFKAGLEQNEFCLWITSGPVGVRDAASAMRKAVPGFDERARKGQIEIHPYDQWYLKDGRFDPARVLAQWIEKCEQASSRGYRGVRLTGNAFRLEKTSLKKFIDYEAELDRIIGRYPIKALCTYSLDLCRAADLIGVIENHTHAWIKRGTWRRIESAHRRRAEEKARAKLESQVRKRTGELREANRRLRGDIAKRRRAEAELRRQKEILQKIFDHSPVMVNFIDRNGRIQMVNREWKRVLGWTLAEIRKKKVEILKEAYPDPRDRRAVMEFVERANGEWMDFKTRIKSGRVIDTTWALVRLSDDTRIGIGQDITDRKRAEEALRSSRRSLRVLAGYLQSAREAEKSRIARELHDEVGQALTGIKLNLERSARARPAAPKDGLDGIVALVNQLIGRVRDLTLDLRPPMLDDLGLLPALRWHFDRYAAQFEIQVDFTHRAIEGARFSRDIETAAYRIAQEALTNVARHAGVRRVKVRISADGAAVRIRIEDQGAGFAHGTLSPGVTAGLSGMRERAALLGGRLQIDSAPGAGTVVAAELPLRVKPDGDESAQSARVEVGY